MAINPQQIYKEFSDITFDSRFDSGNLARVEKTGSQYLGWVAQDCMGTDYEKSYKGWFFFKVSKFQAFKSYKFVIKNISGNFRLLTYMSPVYSIDQTNYFPVPQNQCSVTKNGNLTELHFSFTFSSQEPHYFAFSYPYPYSQAQKMLTQLETQFKNSNQIYAHRETIAYSLEKRPIDMITITSYTQITNERQKSFFTKPLEKNKSLSQIESFQCNEQPLMNTNERPHIFNKPYILFTGRVHPAEVPASHTLQGVVDYIVKKQDILDHFVFCIIPMINPDGVYRGHWRVDTMGQNLNRYYQNPSQVYQPAIWAIDQVVQQIQKKLFLYMDFHAHPSKRGCFIYGNALPFAQQVESRLFSSLLQINCEDFDPSHCDFSQKNMYCADKSDGQSKEGSGRVAFFKKYKIQHCYTIENNFLQGKIKNKLYEKLVIQTGTFNPNHFKLWHDGDIYLQNQRMEPKMHDFYHYGQVGHGVCDSLLDLCMKQKYTRLAGSPKQRLENLRYEIAIKLMQEIPHRYDKVLKTIIKGLTYKKENFNDCFNTLREMLEKKEDQKEQRYRIQTKSPAFRVLSHMKRPESNIYISKKF